MQAVRIGGKRGRPREEILVQHISLNRSIVEAIDRFISSLEGAKPTRPDVMRLALKNWLSSGQSQSITDNSRISWDDLATPEGTLLAEFDIPAIRRQLGMTQFAFARKIGVAIGTLRNWEQGRRSPQGPTRVLLAILQHNPLLITGAISRSNDPLT